MEQVLQVGREFEYPGLSRRVGEGCKGSGCECGGFDQGVGNPGISRGDDAGFSGNESGDAGEVGAGGRGWI